MTKLEVINIALIHAGASPLETLDRIPEKSHRTALVQFDLSRKELLRLHHWNFALTRAEIPALPDAPVFGPGRLYPLPGDFLRLASIYDSFETDFRLEGGNILTERGDPLPILYVADVPDPARWDILFASAVGVHIASKIAFAVTQSTDLGLTLDALFEKSFSRAKWADSTENSRLKIHAERWIASRYGWGTHDDRFHSIVPPTV
jgi:hypothetical protein